MNEIQFKNKKANISKLIKRGFIKNGEAYEYKIEILDGELELYAVINEDGILQTKITDTSCGDEYVLHLVDSAVGMYVGKVKEIHKAFVSYIYNHCFDTEIYEANQAKAVTEHIYRKHGETPEYPFTEETVVFRRTDNRKWFAVLMKISAKKIGLETDEIIEVMNIKMKPEDVSALVDGKKYFTAYHMNKKHWVTIPLDTSVSTEELLEKTDDSYRLAGNKRS